MKYLIFILGFNTMMTVGYQSLAADLRDDRNEFDLYDRMRSNQEFSDYSYPNPQRYEPRYPESQRYEPYYPNTQRYEPPYPESQRYEPYYPDSRGDQSSCPSCQQGRKIYQRDVDDYNNHDSG